eukprot:20501-Heterococcus_DN1.PRE.3
MMLRCWWLFAICSSSDNSSNSSRVSISSNVVDCASKQVVCHVIAIVRSTYNNRETHSVIE